ncbi:SufD family Fe-S cluster assembly protein [Novosphingobium mangrovi (ex Huang et al. 2023)]|uniref:SufD family Fe-S cluster assembly protein n=1 Tax=Novosphingobium mangrovi (ex Huang et al. 2023) TaxID=2976432 RepID=A0ABT2I8V6_9SPHN|nr:SufD family Fe-S cluster assembly protein [Novosphingobium mangrovi (ex Huang et al. 2023)]MCT2401249.1 SufD family Fe-S cluster assembly protein [Novosphingobium mangrovi (ex Huang et al. 2023)]
MSVDLALPTRKDEDFRYSDIEALATLWPVQREQIVIADGCEDARQIVETGEGAVARHLVITLGKGAKLDLRVLTAGPVYGRIAIDVTLAEGADFTLGAAQLATGSETLEIVTDVNHAGPDATSAQVVRTVLAGHSTGTYLGRIAVARGADGTDAEQSVRAMLLDRTATANARPELEIFADDVKAAHGCAVGELDAQGLFYLMSRGLTPPQAKRLMLQAFIAEAFTGAPGEEALSEAALSRLGQLVETGL